MKIFVIIPVYNEETHIKKVLSEFLEINLPIVVVDDGSKDKTFEILKKIKGITLLHHKVNLGKGAALKTGCEYAFQNGADAVITVDGDGQHLSNDLPQFVEAIKNKDIVFGSRNLGYGVPFVRFMGNKFASVLINFLFGIFVSDLLCGFRAFTKKAYEKIKWDSSGYGVETEMVVRTAKARLKHIEVPVATVYHDAVKGVTILDAINILFDVIMWKARI